MSSSQSMYRVGFATTDITPPVGIRLAGFAAHQASTGVTRCALRPSPSTTAHAVRAAVRRLALRRAACARYREATGLPEERFILAAHTRCSPIIREFDKEIHGRSPRLPGAGSRAMTECVSRAWETRAPAQLRRQRVVWDRRLAAKPDGRGVGGSRR